MNEIFFLGGFLVLISFLLAMDLGVLNKNTHEISVKESLIFTAVWISLALLFFLGVRYFGDMIHGIDSMAELEEINRLHKHGLLFTPESSFMDNLQLYRNQLSLEFITGYTIEYALSVDNIFVILMIFISFGVNRKYYHRVLFWGIIGAVAMRFIFIFAVSALIHRFEWILVLFGGLLLFSAVKMFINRHAEENKDVKNNRIVKFVSRHFAVTPDYVGSKFMIRENKKRLITPLFLVLIVIELSDVIFAVDSVPAIFSITHDSYMVFFSNIFAIIGLRSLFFLLSSIVGMFRFLKTGLSVLLAFVGVKMIAEILFDVEIPTLVSLLTILGILAVCILLSLLIPEGKSEKD
jgi:tellurite resistance protein TerC